MHRRPTAAGETRSAAGQVEGAGLITYIHAHTVIIPCVDYDIGTSAGIATARRPQPSGFTLSTLLLAPAGACVPLLSRTRGVPGSNVPYHLPA